MCTLCTAWCCTVAFDLSVGSGCSNYSMHMMHCSAQVLPTGCNCASPLCDAGTTRQDCQRACVSRVRVLPACCRARPLHTQCVARRGLLRTVGQPPGRNDPVTWPRLLYNLVYANFFAVQCMVQHGAACRRATAYAELHPQDWGHEHMVVLESDMPGRPLCCRSKKSVAVILL